jgi:hypothetical protein
LVHPLLLLVFVPGPARRMAKQMCHAMPNCSPSLVFWLLALRFLRCGRPGGQLFKRCGRRSEQKVEKKVAGGS